MAPRPEESLIESGRVRQESISVDAPQTEAKEQRVRNKYPLFRTPTMKVVPTLAGGGNVQGMQTLNEKNNREHPDTIASKMLNPWTLLTAPIGMMAGTIPQTDAQIQRSGKDYGVPWDQKLDARSDTSDEKRLAFMKCENMGAKHMSSSCAVERELFLACTKDRAHHNQQCDTLLENFRACTRSNAGQV